MGSIITLKVTAASISLRPLLEAAPWEGRIAAVFHRSILCTVPQGRLLHFHTGPQLASPFSLRIEEDFVKVLLQAPMVRGMRVQKIGCTIAIAEHVHLGLDGVIFYRSPRLMMGEIEPEAVGIASRVLRAYGRSAGFERLPGIQGLVGAIRHALADGNAAQVLNPARRLIGLGAGLTPSGDDFLVGCLRGLWLLGWNRSAARQTLDRLREALLPDLDARTTRVSAEFIRYALEGAFAEILDQAALSLFMPLRPQAMQSAIRSLLTQGETSGTDTTLGLLTCLEALLCTQGRVSS